jgi:hypothetical protein
MNIGGKISIYRWWACVFSDWNIAIGRYIAVVEGVRRQHFYAIKHVSLATTIAWHSTGCRS